MKHFPFMRHMIVLFMCSLFPSLLVAQINELPRSTPEEEGVPSKALMEMFDSLMAVPQTDIHSVVAVRHGKVIGEIYPKPFAPQYRHTMYSCSKTFVAVAVGLAIDENRLRLNDRVATFFPELLPDSVSQTLADMTVRHLLTMTSGVKPDWGMRSKTTEWIRTFLAKKVENPGEKFQYDSMVTYMLSAIVQRVVGKTVMEYLQEKVFTPMNVTDVAWELSPEGVNTGGWGLHIQSEALAKFAILVLNEGKWQGKQLISSEWIKEMIRFHVATGKEDYGYQTWLCDFPGAVRADGALGQFVIMIPEKDMAFVITECSLSNGKPQRNQFWKLIPQVVDMPLAPSKDYLRLQKKQTSYQLPVVKGKASSTQLKNFADKRFVLKKNKLGWTNVKFSFNKKEATLTITDKEGKTYDLQFGYKQWLTTSMDAYPPYSINPLDCFKGIDGLFWASGSYAWPSSDTLQLKVHYVNWVSALDIKCTVENGKLELTIQENYSRKPFVVEGGLEE